VPHGSYNQAKNSIRATSKVSLLDASYAKYVELCKQQITELRKLEGKRLTTKLREIHNQAREAVKPSSANKNKNNDLLEEKWARIEAREKAGEAGWDHDFNGGDALADDREERRKNFKKNRQNRQSTQYYQVDLANTWNMIEAIVTQNAVRIEKLSIPLAIEEVLLLHAKTNKRPENIIRRVMELNIDNKSAAGNISVTLACSTRDRFMGCRQVNKYRDDAEEQQIQLQKKLDMFLDGLSKMEFASEAHCVDEENENDSLKNFSAKNMYENLCEKFDKIFANYSFQDSINIIEVAKDNPDIYQGLYNYLFMNIEFADNTDYDIYSAFGVKPNNYEDIYEDGLADRIQAAHDALEAYFAELDAQNK
jgi:hypothetical protein